MSEAIEASTTRATEPDRLAARARRSRWLPVLLSPVGAGAGIGLFLLLILAVFGPAVWRKRAEQADVAHMLQGPSAAHWAGTDNLGRDLFARVMVATRLSVELALTATVIAVVAGFCLGAAGFVLGRRANRAVAAVVNVAVAFPGILLALFFAVIFGVGAKGAVLAIGFAGAPAFARLTQTLVAGVEKRDFVAAAHVAGIGRPRVLLRHVLPNIAEPLIVNATIGAGGAFLSFASLSFLGLGVQAPRYDWGRLLGDGLTGIYTQPVAALAPGIAVILAGLAFNLFGEALAKGVGVTATINRPIRGRIRPPVGVPAAPDRPAGAEVTGEADDVLSVQGLTVSFASAAGRVHPVRGVDFRLGRGEAVGIVGESGSGKSLTALAIAQLIEPPGQVRAGQLRFLGHDLLAEPAHRNRRLLGTSLALVFQDPMTSFNPTRRIGSQLAEVGRRHGGLSRRAAAARVVDRLRSVRVPAAERRARQYPHEYSGGMRQRAMIGMGLMGSPALIIADEPTTALDVTVQRQVLDLLQSIRAADGVSLLLISHDIAVVGQVCDRVLVMYAGRIIEELPASALARDSRHPYTRALIAAVPHMQTDRDRPLAVIPGRAPDPAEVPPGCAFAPRCPLASEQCRSSEPPLLADAQGRRVACWHADQVTAGQAGPTIGTPNGARA